MLNVAEMVDLWNIVGISVEEQGVNRMMKRSPETNTWNFRMKNYMGFIEGRVYSANCIL